MSLPPLTRIGFIAEKALADKPLLIHHFFQQKVSFEKDEALFIEMHEEMHVPFFVINAEGITAAIAQVDLLHQKELSNPRTLRRKSVWLPDEKLTTYAAMHCPILYNKFDVYYQGKKLGAIKEWVHQKQQATLMVITGKKERMLPFHESYIHSVDTQAKRLTMAWPENLLSILENT